MKNEAANFASPHAGQLTNRKRSKTTVASATLDRAQQLSAFLSALRLRDIPPRVIDRAKDLMLDHLGVSLRLPS